MFDEDMKQHIINIIQGGVLKEIVGMTLLKQKMPIRMVYFPKTNEVIIGLDPNPYQVGNYGDPRDILESRYTIEEDTDMEALTTTLVERWRRLELSNLRFLQNTTCNYDFMLKVFDCLDTYQTHILDTGYISNKTGVDEYRLVVDGYYKEISVFKMGKGGKKSLVEKVTPSLKNKHRVTANVLKRWGTIYGGKASRVDLPNAFYQGIEDKYYKYQ